MPILKVCGNESESLVRNKAMLPDAAEFGEDVIAKDPAMLRVLNTARSLAAFNSAVLITGETGSGKEVVARTIHRFSHRGSQPWIDVNCAALPEHLVESELFGHEKGAFSGAHIQRKGLLETTEEPCFSMKSARSIRGFRSSCFAYSTQFPFIVWAAHAK